MRKARPPPLPPHTPRAMLGRLRLLALEPPRRGEIRASDPSTRIRLMAYSVTSPNPGFSGTRCGVEFTEGKGSASTKTAAKRLVALGYECPALDAGPAKTKGKDDDGQ